MIEYLISDTHFDDPLILSKSEREFKTLSEMNKVIVNNWNTMVPENASVLFGGDLAHSDIGKSGFWNWYCKLNGIDIILRGNHEPYARSELKDAYLPIKETYEFEYDGYQFCCSHKISGIPNDWDGWKIHGHDHHKRPFLDVEKKRVNISAIQLGYRPIHIEELIQHIQSGNSMLTRPQ